MIKVVLFDVGRVLVRFSGPQFGLYRLAWRLRQKGIRTAILSNVVMVPGVVLKWSHSLAGFSPVILSYEEGLRKPNPEIYKRTIKRLGVKPEEVVFIDNLTPNLLAAAKQGMRTIHAVSTKQVIIDLEAILKKEGNLDI